MRPWQLSGAMEATSTRRGLPRMFARSRSSPAQRAWAFATARRISNHRSSPTLLVRPHTLAIIRTYTTSSLRSRVASNAHLSVDLKLTHATNDFRSEIPVGKSSSRLEVGNTMMDQFRKSGTLFLAVVPEENHFYRPSALVSSDVTYVAVLVQAVVCAPIEGVIVEDEEKLSMISTERSERRRLRPVR